MSGINFVIAVTDGDWFETLRQRPDLDEVNFWSPSAQNFAALKPGELFLFKLHWPQNSIVGGGIFAFANKMPCSLAWETFRESNGAQSALGMRTLIARRRKTDPNDRTDFEIGCRILTQPFFFPEHDWIPVPSSFSRNIVRFKNIARPIRKDLRCGTRSTRGCTGRRIQVWPTAKRATANLL
ncbi:MAG: hypothetical protein OXC10_11110 [Rhodospirillaceae bacterium]|nr:hypothetical protein [Rhodospirillaceae bacterium]